MRTIILFLYIFPILGNFSPDQKFSYRVLKKNFKVFRPYSSYLDCGNLLKDAAILKEVLDRLCGSIPEGREEQYDRSLKTVYKASVLSFLWVLD